MHRRLQNVGLAMLSAGLCLAGVSSCRPAGGADASASGNDPEIWRFAIEESRGSVQHEYALEFKRRVEEKTGGAVQVKVYPYGTLGTSDHITELCHLGTIEFATASPGHLGKVIPEVQVFLLHFLLSDDQRTNHRALRDPDLHAALNELYRKKNFELLSVFSEGWQVWTTKTMIREPSDFDGFKMRVMTSPMLMEAYEAYGASPTPLPYSEVYSALQLNMIDGQVNPVFAIEKQSFYEVTDYMIFPRHAQFITTVTANRRFFEGLSPARRRMVNETIRELHEYVFEVQRRLNEERLALIKQRKPELNIVPELSDENRAKFRKASLHVRDEFVEMTGRDGERLLKRVLDAVEKAEQGQ